ncbi:hypothetical protein [Caldivirga sp.]|uniref:hypothetical protein n=1 Tax=Caldivirga sp. TaxID=2080243 RepID=UPI003D13A186
MVTVIPSLAFKYYETYIPRRFMLNDGSVVDLKAADIEETVSKEPLFQLYVPPDRVDEVYRVLLTEGFRETQLRVLKEGERYSLVKRLIDPWELHVRIYYNGLIESEVEVSREYLEHLGDYRVYVVYEAFNYYSKAYDKLHMLYKPSGRWVVGVVDHVRIRVLPPKTLTPWKPIVAAAGFFAVTGVLLYALSKLEKGGDGGGET